MAGLFYPPLPGQQRRAVPEGRPEVSPGLQSWVPGPQTKRPQVPEGRPSRSVEPAPFMIGDPVRAQTWPSSRRTRPPGPIIGGTNHLFNGGNDPVLDRLN
jgi:hypothetical protein